MTLIDTVTCVRGFGPIVERKLAESVLALSMVPGVVLDGVHWKVVLSLECPLNASC